MHNNIIIIIIKRRDDATSVGDATGSANILLLAKRIPRCMMTFCVRPLKWIPMKLKIVHGWPRPFRDRKFKITHFVENHWLVRSATKFHDHFNDDVKIQCDPQTSTLQNVYLYIAVFFSPEWSIGKLICIKRMEMSCFHNPLLPRNHWTALIKI